MNIPVIPLVASLTVAGLASQGIPAPSHTDADPILPAPTAASLAPPTMNISEETSQLFVDWQGSIKFTLEGKVRGGTASATLHPLEPLTVRHDRPLCVTLERISPDPEVIGRVGQCGSFNVVIQTEVQFGSAVFASFDLEGLASGDYRLSYECDPQAATLTLTATWEDRG